MNPRRHTGGRPPIRHGLASRFPGSAPEAERIEQLTEAFSGDGPISEGNLLIASAAAEAHYRVEQVQTMIDRLEWQAVYHSMPDDADALLERSDLLGLSQPMGNKERVEQLRSV